MACATSCRLLLSGAVLLAVLGATAAARSPPPGYCAAGQAIPRDPLPDCAWYVAIRTCDVAVPVLPAPVEMFKAACCEELRAIPAECRCRALRVMMEAPLTVGSGAAARSCRLAQARFAPAVVSAAECGLTTIHGRPFCNALLAE